MMKDEVQQVSFMCSRFGLICYAAVSKKCHIKIPKFKGYSPFLFEVKKKFLSNSSSKCGHGGTS